MILQLTWIFFILCAFEQVHSTFFGNDQPSVDVGQTRSSKLGNLLRAKAQWLDQIANGVHQTFQTGAGALSRNLNDFGSEVDSSIDATGRLIDNGIAAGKQYGRTIFKGAIIVPKTIHDLVTKCIHAHAYIDVNSAQSLSYVDGSPKYLFQYVDIMGNIIPITAEVATRLVPGFSI